jgi:dipeptidyl-peptidase-4
MLLLMVALAPAARAGECSDPFLEAAAATRNFSLGKPRSLVVTPDGEAVLFLRSGPRSFVQDLYELDLRSGNERALATAASLLDGATETLTPEERALRERQRSSARGIASFQLSDDGRVLLVPISGRLFVVDRASGASRELRSSSGAANGPKLSPDGRSIACVRDGDAWVVDVASGTERRLTTREGATITYGLAEFVAQEEMGRDDGLWWSPDSATLLVARVDVAGVDTLYIPDALHPDNAPQPWPYPRPGRVNAEVTLHAVRVSDGARREIAWDRTRFPYLTRVTWSEGGPPLLLVMDRRQREELLLRADIATGAVTTLLRETDAAWLELPPSGPVPLVDGSGFLWMSERAGTWQLELRRWDPATPPLWSTPPDLGLLRVAHVDRSGRSVVVLTSAEPTETHVVEIPLRSGKALPLTSEHGGHGATFGRGDATWVHSWSMLDGGEGMAVVDRAGHERARLRSMAEDPPFMPRIALERVTERDLRAVVIRPRAGVHGRRLPVVLSAYTGPGGVMVKAEARAYLNAQWLADQGVIVVSIDGRGTPRRGRDWARAWIHDGSRDLIDVALEDQVAGLRELGRRHPEMDMSRVGVSGWSFGGYFAAMAVARRPDVFLAGVAGAPVCDWRDYDTFYTERFLGLPDENAAGYDRSNVLTYVPDLERPLLVVHGTSDDNVLFVNAMKLVDALYREGKDFDFVPLAGLTHMVPDPAVACRKDELVARWLLGQLGVAGER